MAMRAAPGSMGVGSVASGAEASTSTGGQGRVESEMPPTRLRVSGASRRSSQISAVWGVPGGPAAGAGEALGLAAAPLPAPGEGAPAAVGAGAAEAVAAAAWRRARTTSPGGRAPTGEAVGDAGAGLGEDPGEGEGEAPGTGAGDPEGQGVSPAGCGEVEALPRMTSAIEVTWATRSRF
jgi:hypothetical protein